MRPFPRALAVAVLLAASASPTLAASVEEIADGVVGRYMTEKHIPGLSLIVTYRGQTLLARGYGLASVEFNLPATPETIYPISSVSKILAGTVAMRLVEQGRLTLDASIADYYPDVPADKRAITLRMLLDHTHGLEDFYRNEAFGQDPTEVSAAVAIAWSLNRPALTPPGHHWNYELVGYVLLGQILERVSGQSYAELVQKEVFDIAGMTGCSFGGSERVVPGRNATLYEWGEQGLFNHIVNFEPKVWTAGGANCSVTDIAKLFDALEDGRLMKAATRAEMWTEVQTGDGEESYYGLGWFSYRTRAGLPIVGHEGGGASWVLYYPEMDLAVIALSNMSGARADALPHDIGKALIDAGLVK